MPLVCDSCDEEASPQAGPVEDYFIGWFHLDCYTAWQEDPRPHWET